MSLVASGVGLPPDLAQTLSTIGTAASGQIGANYKQAGQQQANDAAIRGLPPPNAGSYGTQRLGQTQALDQGNLNATLGAGLGNTAYNNTLQQRDFGQSEQIADEIGNALRPNTLEQIMAGIGGGTKAAGQITPFLGMLGGSGGMPPGGSGVASSTGVGASGYDPNYGYYYE